MGGPNGRASREKAERTEFKAADMSIVRSQDVDAREVQSPYESVLAKMRRDEVIMDFLPILAARRVKKILLLKRTSFRTVV